MKTIVAALVIALLMILSYAAGRRNTPAVTENASSRRVLYWVDPMHPDYKSDHPGIAPDCGMQLKPVYAEEASAQLSTTASRQLPTGFAGIDAAMQRLAGITTVTVERSKGPTSIRVPGRVVPEDRRVYRIDAGSEGYIRETYHDSVGTLVKKDDKLATCYGPEYLSVASGFLAATASVPGAAGKDGSRTMPFPGALSKQGVSSLQGYTDRLRNLGMSDLQIREMAETRQLPESIYIVSPVDGFIMARNVTPGQHFDRSTEFYRIADLRRVWIVADNFSSAVEGVRVGATAHVSLADESKTFTARVSSLLPEINPATRTLQVRLEAENSGLALRPDMFVDVELPISVPDSLTVPTDAVIDSGSEHRVFVETANGVFEPRPVQIGWQAGERVQILHGLAEGERVVAEGTFLVDSESRLRTSATILPMQHHDAGVAGPAATLGSAALRARESGRGND